MIAPLDTVSSFWLTKVNTENVIFGKQRGKVFVSHLFIHELFRSVDSVIEVLLLVRFISNDICLFGFLMKSLDEI